MDKIEAALDEADAADNLDFEIVSKVGWHGRRFVTPYRVYGVQRRKVRPALGHIKRPHRWCPRGDEKAWREFIARAGKGNSLVIFAVCAAFAPPLLALLRMEGAGIMLVGPTSQGKSTLSWLISSVWGGDPDFKTGFMDSWKTTIGSLEEAAAQSSDCLLVVDDTQQLAGGKGSRADTLAEAIFTLASGIQKSRLTNEGQPFGWRLLYWATANFSARKTLADGGREYDDSIAARLIEVPTNRRFGVFDAVPERTDPAEFSKWIVQQANLHYGEAIDSYLRRLTLERVVDEKELVSWIRRRMSSQRARLGIAGAAGLVDRVADVFCLIYAAGQLARKFGILPFSADELRYAVRDVYEGHRRFVAKDVVESDPIAHVRTEIERLRGSFVDLDGQSDIGPETLIEAPGLVRDTKRGREFIFLPKVFRRTFAGPFSIDALLAALKRGGFLICDAGPAKSSRKNQIKRHIGRQRVRVYCITGAILDRNGSHAM